MRQEHRNIIKALAKSALMPQEEMLEVARKNNSLSIGIPKETSFQENRVSLTPDAVALLVINGNEVIVETGAGEGANFQDRDYSEAGAKIAYSTEEVFKANIILKVEPPSIEEIAMMTGKQFLVSALQLTIQPENYIKTLMAKKITAIAFDFIKDSEGMYPVVRAMSEIAGNTSILIAAELLANNGMATMLGGIAGVAPTEVIILGAGTVGEFAARAAIGLGASIKVFDNNIYKLKRLQNNLNMPVYTSVIAPGILKEALRTADVAIGAIRSVKGRTPCVVTQDMISQMKFGSVIIDVSIDQGGCFETSRVTNHSNPTFKSYGVTHYCVPNIASKVSRTASSALSNTFSPLLLEVGESGGFEEFLRFNPGVRNGVYIYNGILTNKFLGESLQLPYQDIELLMAAF
jgi:alanine dehydrogenase